MHAERSYRWLFWTLAFAGLALDQVSKYWIFQALYNEGRGGEYVLVADTFNLEAGYPHPPQPIDADGWRRPLQAISGELLPQVNHGALWGARMWLDDGDSNRIFAAVSLIAALAIVIWSTRSASRREGLMCLALGLILAGAVGNLYDRVIFGGVRDFLHWYRWINWAVFNVADCCLVCGAGVLLVQAFFLQPASETAVADVTSAASRQKTAV